ncbi:MBL fold metallo-hydrolase [Streptosporangiaceae bacterium NEAU-GS5]|nr:MBL fold metallo-hydrolase [Streptosporangiaceae bacterium NEAU-GS5]
MKLTKFGHACWRVEKDGRTLVIDPGSFSGDSLIDGADAVLVTHEHFDHFNEELLKAAGAGVEIWACPPVAAKLGDAQAKVQAVRHGDGFTTAGFGVKVVGEWHARVHPDIPIIENVGFLLDDEVFYPGDALTPPGADVPTLLVPTNAPWLKGMEMIEYLRAVRPTRAYSTHDGLANEIGLGLIDTWLDMESKKQNGEFRRIAPGGSVEI